MLVGTAQTRLCPPYEVAPFIGSRSHTRQRHPQSVARFWDRPHLPIRRVSGLQRDVEILQEMPREAFRLHIGEVQPEAHMRAAAERHPGEAMTAALRLVGEAHRIEGI